MDDFPVSIRGAAIRLGIPPKRAYDLVDVLGIPTRLLGRIRTLDRAGFDQLEAALGRLIKNRRLARSAG